jgi:hypothetical protein
LSKLALFAPCFPVSAVALTIVYYHFHLSHRIGEYSLQIHWWTVVALFACGALTGTIAIYRCNRSRGRLEGDVFAYLAVIVCAFLGCPATFIAKLAADTWSFSPG